jgi:hypothetical protein
MENLLDVPDRWTDFVRERYELFEIADLPKDVYRSHEAFTTFLAAEWHAISVAPEGVEKDTRVWALVELVADYFKESQAEFYEPALFSFLDKKWKFALRVRNPGRRSPDSLGFERGLIAAVGIFVISIAISMWVFRDVFEAGTPVRASLSVVAGIGGLYCLYVAFLAPRSTVKREFKGL